MYEVTSDILKGPNKAAVSMNGSILVLTQKVRKQTKQMTIAIEKRKREKGLWELEKVPDNFPRVDQMSNYAKSMSQWSYFLVTF